MELTLAILCVIMIYGFVVILLKKWNDESVK